MIKTHGNQEVSSLTALKPKSKRWHLDPVSVTKIEKKPHSVSEVKESHSVFSNLNGNKHGFKQEHKQGRFDLIKNKVGFNISMRSKKKSQIGMLFQILQNVTKIYKKSMDNSKDSSGTATFYFGTVGSLTSMKLNRFIHSTNS